MGLTIFTLSKIFFHCTKSITDSWLTTTHTFPRIKSSLILLFHFVWAAVDLNTLIFLPDWCDLMWDFKFPRLPKVAGHRLHFKCLILMWTTLTCSWRYGPRLNFLWQCGHSNFLIFLWIVSICRFWKKCSFEINWDSSEGTFKYQLDLKPCLNLCYSIVTCK